MAVLVAVVSVVVEMIIIIIIIIIILIIIMIIIIIIIFSDKPFRDYIVVVLPPLPAYYYVHLLYVACFDCIIFFI